MNSFTHTYTHAHMYARTHTYSCMLQNVTGILHTHDIFGISDGNFTGFFLNLYVVIVVAKEVKVYYVRKSQNMLYPAY